MIAKRACATPAVGWASSAATVASTSRGSATSSSPSWRTYSVSAPSSERVKLPTIPALRSWVISRSRGSSNWPTTRATASPGVASSWTSTTRSVNVCPSALAIVSASQRVRLYVGMQTVTRGTRGHLSRGLGCRLQRRRSVASAGQIPMRGLAPDAQPAGEERDEAAGPDRVRERPREDAGAVPWPSGAEARAPPGATRACRGSARTAPGSTTARRRARRSRAGARLCTARLSADICPGWTW